MTSNRDFVQRVYTPGIKVDILINNAFIMTLTYALTEKGFKVHLGTNFLGRFLLTERMLPSIKAAASGARIICLSALGHM